MMMGFARPLTIPSTIVELELGADRIVVERVLKNRCYTYPDDGVTSCQVVVRHLLVILVLVTVLYFDAKPFPEIGIPIRKRCENVGAAFGYRCCYLRNADVYLCLDLRAISELLIEGDLSTGDCSLVRLRLSLV